MGVSKLVGLKAAVMLLAFYSLKKYGFHFVALPFLHSSLVALLVSIASHPFINLPLLLGKTSDGKFPLWSKIVFGPFLYFVWGFTTLRRLYSREPSYNEICEGVFVGGWPSSLDKLPPGGVAVIDCTAELPRRAEVVRDNAYLCVPTWDTRSPTPMEIESAVKWACRMRGRNMPVFIHCAFGHGRSVAVLCALLVALGVAGDWKDAERLTRERRPWIHMNSFHRKNLEEWSKHRFASKKLLVKA